MFIAGIAVYSAAGMLLLDRSLPDGYRRDWTEYFSSEKKRVTRARCRRGFSHRGRNGWRCAPRTFQEVLSARDSSSPHTGRDRVWYWPGERTRRLLIVSAWGVLGMITISL